MQILVTGGFGFVGSNLCLKLLGEGHHVICLDRRIDQELSHHQFLLNHSRCKVINHDVKDPVDFDVDQIYHLACPASPVEYQQDPIDTTKTAFLGTLNMLELANKRKIRLLQASTSEIYGTPEQHPQSEDYWGRVNPIGVRSCYNEGKRAAESLCMDFYRKYQVDVRLIRIFNTYGPFMRFDDGRVIINFVVNALLNKDLILYGDGLQTRSFLYIDDLIQGMTQFMSLKQPIPYPVNIGNPEEISILDLANIVIALCETESQLRFTSCPSDDPNKRKPDIARARQILDWEPLIPLKEGLKKTITYYRSILYKPKTAVADGQECHCISKENHATAFNHHSLS